MIDQLTRDRGKISFARVLVRMKIRKPIKEIVCVQLPEGKYTQVVQYEWYPIQCSKCKLCGHSEMCCLEGNQGQNEERKSEEEKHNPYIVQVTHEGQQIGSELTVDVDSVSTNDTRKEVVGKQFGNQVLISEGQSVEEQGSSMAVVLPFVDRAGCPVSDVAKEVHKVILLNLPDLGKSCNSS